jgi:hypothetical protein
MMRPMLIIAAALALAGCGGDAGDIGDSAERTISGFGVSIDLPPGWEGRIVKPEPEVATHVVATHVLAGNFSLPSAENFLGPETAKAMGPQSLYVWAAGFDSAHEQLSRRWIETSLPIPIGRADFGPFEGVASPVEAVRWVIVEEKAILVMVGFGAVQPSDDLIAEANAVLATLALD